MQTRIFEEFESEVQIIPPIQSDVVPRDEFLYPAATPLLVKARGGVAIANEENVCAKETRN